MNGGTIRGTTLPIDGTAHPWMGRFLEWVGTHINTYMGMRYTLATTGT
jgi:hypothetical protein